MKVTKATERILKNPFCILGLPCNAEKMDIIKAQEKLNKLSKIGAEKSYKASFCSEALPEIDRSAGIIQAAMVNIDEPVNNLFWYVNETYLQQFASEDVRNELIESNNFDSISYDCFLANYLYLLLKDAEFTKIEHWNKLFKYIEFLLSCDILKFKQILYSHYNDKLDDNAWNAIASSFSKHILFPVEALADDSNAKTILSIINIIANYNTIEFSELSNSILERLVSEVDKECSFVFDFIDAIDNIQNPSKSDVKRASEMANNLINIGKELIHPLLKSSSINNIVLDRIKDTYYTEIMKLANVLAYGKSYKNAYACVTYANKYAPSHKKKESKETLEMLKELKAGEEAIEKLGGISKLSKKETELINNKDIAICSLVYRSFAGDAESQCILGNIYKTPVYERNGALDIAYDVSEGLKWLKKSANQGYSKAQLELGACYLTGQGVTQDIAKADFWIQKAVDGGNDEAIKFVNDYRYKEMIKKAKGIGWGSVIGALIFVWPIGLIMLIVKIVQISMFDQRRCDFD